MSEHTPTSTDAHIERTLEDFQSRFVHHKPDARKVRNGMGQMARYQFLRDAAHTLAQNILHMTPPSREQSLAFTHLEQAIMWANSAIARRE